MVTDGLDRPDINLLATAACGGRYRSNAERDVLRRASRGLRIDVGPYALKVPASIKQGLRVKTSLAYVVLPHEMWACLSRRPDLRASLFGTPSQLAQWWTAHREDDWFREHPMRGFILKWPHRACPYVIHGDEAPLDKRGKRCVRVLQWSSPVAIAITLKRKMIIGMHSSKAPQRSIHEDTIARPVA